MTMKEILTQLRTGDISVINPINVIQMNNCASEFLNNKSSTLSDYDLEQLDSLIRICNILYNRTDCEQLPIEDGVYDILLEYYKTFNPNFQVGSEVIDFKDVNDNKSINENISPIRFLSDEEISKRENGFFYDRLGNQTEISIDDCKKAPIKFTKPIEKRTHNTAHNHPELVGTLDKCKFVLMADAEEKGVANDSNVKVLERDFFAKHIMQGIISPDQELEMIIELKYDGISVEADCRNTVESARTRGDTGIGQASDITPILDGYPFTHASEFIGEDLIGVKFEAIMTYADLYKFNYARNTSYKNGRTAIVGLFGASDANLYRDYITLIPLAIDRSNVPGVNWNRALEIEFLNKYFATKCHPLKYCYIKGNYKECLFYIKAFQEEAELARSYLDFMYDGIVVSYLDEGIRNKLGRENYINKYSMAVKFNPLKKQTIFNGYTYTVGQDGSITPMIHYNQVEFFGTLHNKSTGNSYGRFKELQLKIGDIIDVEYVNDVMPRVYKFNCKHNEDNINPVEEFTTICPSCGSPVSFTDKSAYCMNPDCPGRLNARLANMMDKLNLKGFAENSLEALKIKSFEGLINLDRELAKSILGEVNGSKLCDLLNALKITPIEDASIVGSLGFNNVASKTWRLIFSKYTIKEFMELYHNNPAELSASLKHIKGIGEATVDTIFRDMKIFYNDILYIMNSMNIVNSKDVKLGKQIRCTGFRDKELFAHLRSLGLDADDNGSVTKSTDILLVPYEGFNSSKINKVDKDKTIIVTREEFINNMNKYI